MAKIYNLLKPFKTWLGLDLRSSDVNRPAEYATEILNVDYRKTGAMNKRKGYKWITKDHGGCGITTYLQLNDSTNALDERLVVIDEQLNVLEQEKITITYSGTNTCYINIALKEDGNFYFEAFEDNNQFLDINLGKDIDDTFIVTVQSLVDQINASGVITASAPININESATNLEITENLLINPTGELCLNYFVSVPNPTGTTSFFTDLVANKDNPEYENPTFANINSSLYIASAYHDLLKYDGNRLYKAGLPKPLDITIEENRTIVGGEDPVILNGVGDVTEYFYQVVYRFEDANGNIITSEPSNPLEFAPVSNQVYVELNIPNIEHGSGFDTDSTITIEIYRTLQGAPQTFYLIDEINNDPNNPTQIYNDVADNELDGGVVIGPPPGAFSYIQPIKPHSLPPRMKYIHVYQGLLVGTGNNDSINTTYYSDIDSPEYFPVFDNAFDIDTQIGDRNTGISSLGNSLFVFRNESIHQVLGNLADDTFSVDYYGNARIGCAAHHTIREVNGFLYFLSRKGVFALDQNGQQLREVSLLIEQLFTKYDTPYNFKRAVAINHLENDKYLLYMPVNTNETDLSASEESEVFAYDYVREAWLRWDGINALSGFTLFNRDLYFNEVSQAHNRLAKIHNTGSTQDYADHTDPITFIYKSHWEDLGEPSVFKKFLRVNVISLDASLDDFESDKFTLNYTSEIDWIDSPSTIRTLDFGGNQLGWGLDPWGLFPWGNERLDRVRTKMLPVKCKSLRTILENDTLIENVLISIVEYEVATSYMPFIKE